MALRTPLDLQTHVALAIDVELSTIPLYLYALYSIEDETSDAAMLIRSVATEEMLHVALATNLLLGLGGEPAFGSPDVVPRYPAPMKHHSPELTLDLAPCSVDLVRDVFMVIERPETHNAPPEADSYETLGQFYHALEVAIETMGSGHDLFSAPQRDRQMASASYYTPVEFDTEGSGGLVLIDDVASACQAIEIIVHQGEGLSEERWADPDHQELTHFSKYQLIADGTVPLPPVSSAPTNPRTSHYPPHLRPVSDLFNAIYRSMFFAMEAIFSGAEAKRESVGRLYRTMTELMTPVARYLLRQPLDDGLVAAPTFELFAFATDDPLAELEMMARAVGRHHEDLTPIADTIRELKHGNE